MPVVLDAQRIARSLARIAHENKLPLIVTLAGIAGGNQAEHLVLAIGELFVQRPIALVP